MGILGQQTDYFGLDIGYTAARLVQVSHKKGDSHPTLTAYHSIALPPGLAASDSPADISTLAGIVQQLVKEAKVGTKLVVAGLPSSKVFASIITTPVLTHEQLAKAIPLQADQYIPMALKDVKLDWVVMGPGKTAGEQEVLLVAAANNVTQKYVSLAEQAGLELFALEPNAIALARAVVAPNDLAVLVLDIGALSSDITIVQAKMPKLLRSINIGGNTFVKAVEQNLGLDSAQADQFTKKFGLTQTKLEGQVFKAIKPSLDQLVAEIDKSVKFFMSQYPQVKLEKMVLCGGTTALPELPTYLSTAAGMAVEISNAWSQVGYPANRQSELMAVATTYGVAAGLAERDAL